MKIKIINKNANVFIQTLGCLNLLTKTKLKGDSQLWQNGQTQGAVTGHAPANISLSILS